MLPEEVGFEKYPGERPKNARGNIIHRRFLENGDRYIFDFEICTPILGWKQYDTTQDAWYFGMWVNPEKRQTVTYCEQDITIVDCPTEESYHAELAHAAEFYGPPPPAAVGYGCEDGKVVRTEFYDERPT